MKQRTLHPSLQWVAALAILGVVLGAAIAAIAAPLVDAIAAREAAIRRVARYQGALQAERTAGPIYKPADLSAMHVDQAEAQLALQASVDRLARKASVNVQSFQPMAAEFLGGIGRGVWADVSFSCDLQALTEFLSSFDAERPLLLVRRLEVDRGEGPRPDIFLRVKLEIGQAWRASGDPA